MHPNDLLKIGTLKPHPSTKPPKPPPLLPRLPSLTPASKASSAPSSATPAAIPSPASSPTVSASNSPTLPTKTPPGSRQSSLRGRNASNNHLELLKYTEADDEDYSDMFDGQGTNDDGWSFHICLADGAGTNTMGSLQLTRRSNRSWQEDDDEGVDPFAELEDDFATDSYEENLRRDRRAAKQASVERLIARLDVNLQPGPLKEVSEELVSARECCLPDRPAVHARERPARYAARASLRAESGYARVSVCCWLWLTADFWTY